MTRFSRRALMKGLGAGLFAPFFREAFAQVPTPGRLVIVLECNGIYPEALLSSAARSALGMSVGTRHNFADTYPSTPLTLSADALSTALCLGPLAASGSAGSLEGRSAVVLGLSSLIAGGGHSSGTGGLSSAVNGASITIDAALAPRLKSQAPFDAIRLGTSSSLTPIVVDSRS